MEVQHNQQIYNKAQPTIKTDIIQARTQVVYWTHECACATANVSACQLHAYKVIVTHKEKAAIVNRGTAQYPSDHRSSPNYQNYLCTLFIFPSICCITSTNTAIIATVLISSIPEVILRLPVKCFYCVCIEAPSTCIKNTTCSFYHRARTS